MSRYLSWGRLPRVAPARVIPLSSREELPDLSAMGKPVLAYGLGRSYGDSCLNGGGVLLATRGLSRFIAFDEETGSLCCEAGTSLAEILETFVPRGWSVPVTPTPPNHPLGSTRKPLPSMSSPTAPRSQRSPTLH